MSESQDPKDPATPPRAPGPAALEYQPPAVAWEEPLEAIAALSCTFMDTFECGETVSGG